MTRSRSRGLSLIELLVVIAIVGLLISLTIPALQYAREAARRSTCSAHLRQLALAVTTYAEGHRFLPPGLSRGFSFQAQVLPYLEQHALYNGLNFAFSDSGRENATVVIQEISVLLCPSDSAQRGPPQPGPGSYCGNAGNGHQKFGYNGVFGSPNFRTVYREPEGYIAYADIPDGVTHTAAISEHLVADGSEGLRAAYATSTPRFLASELQAFAYECWFADVIADRWWRGLSWANGNPGITLYNHVLTPQLKGCFNETRPIDGIYPPSSLHAGNVHIALLDGSVRLVSATVASDVWQALGSRNGSESVSSSL